MFLRLGGKMKCFLGVHCPVTVQYTERAYLFVKLQQMEDECPDTVQKWTSTTRLNFKKAISIIFLKPLLTSRPVFPAESLNFKDIISVDLQSLLA